MPKGWSKELEDKVLEAVDGLEEDEIVDAIKEALSIEDIVSEIFDEEKGSPEVKAALRKKVEELIVGEIENIDSLDELLGDDSKLGDFLPEGLVEEAAKEAFTKKDSEVRDALMKQLQSHVEESDLSDLIDIDDFQNSLDIEKIVKEMVEKDEEVRTALSDAVKAQVKSYIDDNFDNDDLPDNLSELFGLDEVIKNLAGDQKFKEEISQALIEYIRGKIENDGLGSLVNEDELYEKLDTSGIIQSVAADPQVKAEVENELKDNLKQHLLRRLVITEDMIKQVMESPNLASVLRSEADVLARDNKFLDKVQDAFKHKMLNSPEVANKLFEAMFAEMAKHFVAKLLR